MRSIPRAAEPLIQDFAGAFTRPTYQRFVVLLFAAILTTGRRTVTNPFFPSWPNIWSNIAFALTIYSSRKTRNSSADRFRAMTDPP